VRIASIQIKANDLGDSKQAWDRLEHMVLDAARNHDLILVPECAYPAYFLHPDEGNLQSILSDGEALLSRIKDIAKQEKAYIAYGYAEKSGEQLYNTALLIDRQGNEVIKKRKSFLWHFDHVWFSEGDDVAVADTDFGRVGLVVCADARMPEIVRLAALEGAQLIIDLANLTATGPDISALQNAQCAYMLSVRALENQVWLAVSDKWGVEANSITYAGRSGIFSPDGTCVFQAGSDRDEIVSAEIPTDHNGTIVAATSVYNVRRRPELYDVLTRDTDSLPITRIMEEKAAPFSITPYITVASGEFSGLEDYLLMIRRLVNHGGGIICMPPSRVIVDQHTDQIRSILPQGVVVTATSLNDRDEMTTYVINGSGVQAVYRTLHTEENSASPESSPLVYDTQWGKIGIMHGNEALLPEWPRVLMLLGADCVIWPNQIPTAIASNVARTRAAESRIYVVSAQATGEASGVSQIIDPNGMVLASTLQNETKHACGVLTPFGNSRMKEIVPGTNVVKNRHPECYGRLTL
jgi:predicted amidohydrolase